MCSFFRADGRTPGPVTGGAEVTGSSSMRLLADKNLRASPATNSQATSYRVELNEPLTLSWDVSPLAPAPALPQTTPSARDDAGGRGGSSDDQAATGTTPPLAAAADGVVFADGAGDTGVPMKAEKADKRAGAVGTGKVNSKEKAEAGVWCERGGEVEGDAGLRLREPAWARLLFADRKR